MIESVAFNIIIGLSLLSSVAFEMNGVYSIFGISVYFFLTVLIAVSKIYISFFRNSLFIIVALSLITAMFASLDVINHYIESKKEVSHNKDTLMDLQKSLELNRQQQQSLIKREESFNKTLSYGYSPKSVLSSSKDNSDYLKKLQEEERTLQNKIIIAKESTTFNPFKSLITLIFILTNELILAYLLMYNKKKIVLPTEDIIPNEVVNVEKNTIPNTFEKILISLEKEEPLKNPLIINVSKIEKTLLDFLIQKGYITSKNNHVFATKYESIIALSKER